MSLDAVTLSPASRPFGTGGMPDYDDEDALMKLTDALLGEHAILYGLFEHVRDTTENSDDAREISGAVAVLERLLLSHAQVEENLLFTRLEPHLGPMGPLAVMRSEHRAIDELLEAAKQTTDIGLLNSVIDQLLALAQGHFRKEETALFAMAEQVLDEVTLTELGDEWAKYRNVTVGGQGSIGTAQ